MSTRLVTFNSFLRKDFLRILLCQTVLRNTIVSDTRKYSYCYYLHCRTKENYDYAISKKQHFSNLAHFAQSNENNVLTIHQGYTEAFQRFKKQAKKCIK